MNNPRRPSEQAAREAIETWLDKHAPGYPDYSQYLCGQTPVPAQPVKRKPLIVRRFARFSPCLAVSGYVNIDGPKMAQNIFRYPLTLRLRKRSIYIIKSGTGPPGDEDESAA